MNIQVAAVCDAATNENEKLNLLGAFDTICAQQMPAVHPQCSVALRITFAPVDEGAHRIKLAFMDADARPVMPGLDIPVEIKLPDESHFVSRNFVLNIQQLKFDAPGFYSIEVSVDDKPLANIPLLVKLLQPTAPTAGEAQ